MSNQQKITLWVILGCAAILIGYDLYAASVAGENTISWVLLQLAHDYPAIPFAFGFLFGHIFGTQHGDK